MKRSAVAVRHVSFESLGTFEHELTNAGYTLDYIDVTREELRRHDPLQPDLLVILGGPIGAYETEAYPFLRAELAFISARIDAGLPLLGICLGAQLIAVALGAKVAPTGVKEIGFAPLTLTEAGKRSSLCALEGVPVLHWHSDAFDVPDGAELLATTPIANQAFALGGNVLALQFHPEPDTSHSLEEWLVGHACELASAGIAPETIRRGAREHGFTLQKAGRAMFAEWLREVGSNNGNAT